MKREEWVKGLPRQLTGLLHRYGLVLLVLAVGLLLMLWPQGAEEETAAAPAAQTAGFDLEELEERMERALSRIQGAGEVTLLLTLKNGGEQRYAADTQYSQDETGREERSSTVLISTGSGSEQAVVVSSSAPEFQGALVVCDGGDDPDVRLRITQAVAALTGLRSDKITVCR